LDDRATSILQDSAHQVKAGRFSSKDRGRFESGAARSPHARILYVDDEANISRVIKYGLEKFGFSVDTHASPRSALSSFRAGLYDLLLIDVRLPEIDGLELCSQLLKIDAGVKVCFITAYELEEEEVRKRIEGLKSASIVKKPVSFDELVAKIKNEMQSV
jgi:DNA-binding response OmpR family regulator